MGSLRFRSGTACLLVTAFINGIVSAWQSGLSDSAGVGAIIGLFINGIVSERYAYKKTMIGALLSTIAFIFIAFFAQNLQSLQVYEILMGIPW
jgi:SP family general alpha glucoside:H+ symporter-like MFS transporter